MTTTARHTVEITKSGERTHRYPCGCEAYVDAVKTPLITYCPLHRAAPRMLEALRALYELAPLSNDDAVQRVYSEVRAILSLR